MNDTSKKIPVVDQGTCIGCTLCTQICPNVFKMMDDGKSDVIDPKGDPEDKIQESIDACPSKSISFKEE